MHLSMCSLLLIFLILQFMLFYVHWQLWVQSVYQDLWTSKTLHWFVSNSPFLTVTIIFACWIQVNVRKFRRNFRLLLLSFYCSKFFFLRGVLKTIEKTRFDHHTFDLRIKISIFINFLSFFILFLLFNIFQWQRTILNSWWL